MKFQRRRQVVAAKTRTQRVSRVSTLSVLDDKEFYPEFRARDLVGLPNFSIYLKMMIDGVVSNPFSGETLGPIAKK